MSSVGLVIVKGKVAKDDKEKSPEQKVGKKQAKVKPRISVGTKTRRFTIVRGREQRVRNRQMGKLWRRTPDRLQQHHSKVPSEVSATVCPRSRCGLQQLPARLLTNDGLVRRKETPACVAPASL